MSMFKPKRIYEYIGDTNSEFDRRITDRCGVFGIEAQTGTGGDGTDGNAGGAIGTVEKEFGTPEEVTFNNTPLYVGCEGLTDLRYIIVSVVTDGGSTIDIEAVRAAVAADRPVTPAFGATQTINSSRNDWRSVSIAKLTATKWIVFGRTTTLVSGEHEVYAMVCEVDDAGTITSTAPQLVHSDVRSASGTGADEPKCISVDDGERAILIWESATDAGGSVFPLRGAVVTVPEGSTTISVGAHAQLGDVNCTRFDIDKRNVDPNSFQILGAIATGLTADATQGREVTLSGTTLTAGTMTGPLGIDSSGSTVLANTGGGVYTYVAGGPTGSDIVAADASSVIDTASTTDNSPHQRRIDVEVIRTANSIRIFFLYGTDGLSPDYLEMEIFTYDGSVTTSEVHRFQTMTIELKSLNIAQSSLTATKSPFVYIDQDASPDVVKTVVFEGGTG